VGDDVAKGRNGKREGRGWEEGKGGWEGERRARHVCVPINKKITTTPLPPDQRLCPWTPLGAPLPVPHHSEEIAATEWAYRLYAASCNYYGKHPIREDAIPEPCSAERRPDLQ